VCFECKNDEHKGLNNGQNKLALTIVISYGPWSRQISSSVQQRQQTSARMNTAKIALISSNSSSNSGVPIAVRNCTIAWHHKVIGGMSTLCYWCEYVEAVRNRESCCIYIPSVVTFFMESVNCICRDGKDMQKPQPLTTNAWFHVSWYWWSFWLLLILYYNQYPELWSCVLTVTSYSFLQSTKKKGKQKGMTKGSPTPWLPTTNYNSLLPAWRDSNITFIHSFI